MEIEKPDVVKTTLKKKVRRLILSDSKTLFKTM